jgi:hypothetical protein
MTVIHEKKLDPLLFIYKEEKKYSVRYKKTENLV